MGKHQCIVCASGEATTFLRQDQFAVLACVGCGLRYLEPQPTPEELTALYGEAYFARQHPGQPGYDQYLEETDNHRRTFEHRLGLLPAPPGDGTVLDVGAATGLFVERARARGWNATGIEPSAWAAAHARNVHGQPVVTGMLADQQLPAGSVDMVTLWEVIEHVPDPAKELREIHRVLRPGGTLALSTPDAGSLVARLLGRKWPGWRKIPEHLFHFDRRSLARLLTTVGFEVQAMHYVPLIVSRRYLLDRGHDLLGVRLDRWGLFGDLNAPIRVNPYYDLFVRARAI